MEKHNKNNVLDADILEMLATDHVPAELDAKVIRKIKDKLMHDIAQTKATDSEVFSTTIASDSEGWIEGFPGASFKVLRGDASIPNSILSYLIRLEAGFKMKGHEHLFDEETLMLEGDLTLGDDTYHTGDFHFAAAGSCHGNVSTENGCIAYMRGALPI